MASQIARFVGIALVLGFVETSWGQDGPPEVPKGVEVQARGPVHEAFATPLGEAQPTPPIPRKPPAPIEELAPEERPEGNAIWIGGYWAWDDERRDFLWVSGCWRVKPAGKEWVPGYWRDASGQSQWVSGFWTTVQDDRQQNLTYFPQPPAPPQVAPPAPQAADEFYVPGYWMWYGDRYVWRAGYSSRIRPGYVFVAAHYRWTPSGYVFIPGYWDYAIAQRGLLYAPVIVDPVVVGPAFVYTPRYAVTDTLVIDSFFVRPAYGHYYFGDYYGPGYVQLGYEPVVIYSRRCYEPIIVYRQWEYRQSPRWLELQIAIYGDRAAGRTPVPPRTLVQQNTIIQNNITVNNVTINRTAALAPASSVLAARGQRTVPLDAAARTQVQKSASTAQQSVAAGRQHLEQPTNFPPTQPRAATLNVTAAPARTHGGPMGSLPPMPTSPIKPAAPFAGGPVAPLPSTLPKGTSAPATGFAPNPVPTPLAPTSGQPVVGSPSGPNGPTPLPNGVGPARVPSPAPSRPSVQPPPGRPTAPPHRDDERKKGGPS